MLPGYGVEGILAVEGQNDLIGAKARSRVMDCTKQLYELSGPVRMPTAKLEDAGVDVVASVPCQELCAVHKSPNRHQLYLAVA